MSDTRWTSYRFILSYKPFDQFFSANMYDYFHNPITVMDFNQKLQQITVSASESLLMMDLNKDFELIDVFHNRDETFIWLWNKGVKQACLADNQF